MRAYYELYRDKERVYRSVNTHQYTERLKKLRALNYDPSRMGHETYEVRSLPFSRMSILTKGK